ncbi:hypothetical protein LY78DRAFT_662036 [Colletotrichum sublineola]|nr:hypothetical protein LY78DRAFT_662036 [Colletotrichum sublineola]
MAANEFHLFSLLPGELRDQMCGINQFVPMVFAAFNISPSFPTSLKTVPPSPFAATSSLRRKNDQLVLIGPPKPENTESLPSWNLNQSTYSIDGGLWTACEESRAAMARRYSKKK